jgi:hypothetical protein
LRRELTNRRALRCHRCSSTSWAATSIGATGQNQRNRRASTRLAACAPGLGERYRYFVKNRYSLGTSTDQRVAYVIRNCYIHSFFHPSIHVSHFCLNSSFYLFFPLSSLSFLSYFVFSSSLLLFYFSLFFFPLSIISFISFLSLFLFTFLPVVFPFPFLFYYICLLWSLFFLSSYVTFTSLHSVSPTRIRALIRHFTTTSYKRPTSSAPSPIKTIKTFSHGSCCKNRNPPRDQTQLLQRPDYDSAYA